MYKIKFNPIKLKYLFSHKVRQSCKQCKRYSYKATCPPNCETIEYYNYHLPTYKNGVLIIEKFNIDSIDNWKQLGEDSSNVIRQELLKIRQELLNSNHPISIIFGAGSCKNCKECSFPCRFPEQSTVPIEATGLNVIQLVKNIADIDITFPVEKQEYFYRIGMVLYD